MLPRHLTRRILSIPRTNIPTISPIHPIQVRPLTTMDKLPAFGTAIATSVGPTMQSYFPLLQANSTAIRSTPFTTHSYGPLDRQQLDVYKPAASGSSPDSSPILMVVHGGGFIQGSKSLPMAQGLAHANVGHFYASTFGYTVVIIDYRLMSHGARFPSGGEDVALAVRWTAENLGGAGSQRPLYLMGNSAGGVHVLTFVLGAEFADTRALVLEKAGASSGVKLAAVVGVGVPTDFEGAAPNRSEVLLEYFGSAEGIERDAPEGLLRRAQPTQTELSGVRFLLVNSELDPEDEILRPMDRFEAAWEGEKPARLVAIGHNHISLVLAVGTGIDKEEKWGRDVGEWLQRG